METSVVLTIFRKINVGMILGFEIWLLIGVLGAISYRNESVLTIEPPCSNVESVGYIKFRRFVFESEAITNNFVRFKGIYLKYGNIVILIGKSNDSMKGFPTLFRRVILDEYESCITIRNKYS